MTTANLRAAALDARNTVEQVVDARDTHTATCATCELRPWECPTGRPLQKAVLDAAQHAWEAFAAYLPAGTVVTYTGSKADLRGPGWTIDGGTQGACGIRYDIARGAETLSWVRLESIAVDPYVTVPEAITREIGLCPVRLTAAAWADCVAWPGGGGYQDEEGRLWDVIVRCHQAARGLTPGGWQRFALWRVPFDGSSVEAVETELRVRLERDGDGPVLTIDLAPTT